MARLVRIRGIKGNVHLLMLEETGKQNQLFDLAMAFRTTKNREGKGHKEYEVTRSPQVSREFIPPPEGTLKFLGCVCRNH